MGLESMGGDDNRPDASASDWPGEQTPKNRLVDLTGIVPTVADERRETPKQHLGKLARKAQTPGTHKPRKKAK